VAVECAEVATRDRHGDTSFLRVNVWRGQAEHLADSPTKGSPRSNLDMSSEVS
jgi:single-stranded DNA-binding protein